jgi:hypothetical protein
MIWVILAALGVPLWLCAVGITVIVFRTRGLSRRGGNIHVRVLRSGHTRWTRGQGLWVSDVFAWRGSPAAWAEDLVPLVAATSRSMAEGERKALHSPTHEPGAGALGRAT